MYLDFETDNEQFGSPLKEENDIILACWQVVHPSGKIEKKEKWGGVYEMQELLDDIADASFLVAHNLKFELGWLRRCGLELRDVLGYDTMLAQWVIDGNRKGKGFERSLAALTSKYGLEGKVDLVSKLISEGVSCRDIHPAWLLEYCHQDVEATRQLFLAQQAVLTELQLWHLVYVRCLTCAALADIEFEGLTLDAERVNEAYVKAKETLEELGAALSVMTGGINLGSPKQLGQYLYNTLNFPPPKDHRGKPVLTAGGDVSTNSKVLETLKAETEEQRRFLSLYKEYNKAASLVEKNLDYFRLTCEQKGGTFRGEFKQNVVQTHRLASSGIKTEFVVGTKKDRKGNITDKTKEMSVQMQNIPREFKRLFCSGEDDWLIGEVDSAQLEFRVAVDMAHDPVGYEEISTGVDIHSFTAKVLLDNNDPEITALPASRRRQESKKFSFKPLYGGRSGSPAVMAYCDFFRDKYTGISEMQRQWQIRCLNDGKYVTPYGMVFYFPDTKMMESGYITNSTSICNFAVQGFATGEIIPIALVYFWHRTRGKNIRIYSTIHDSIAARVHKDSQEEFMEIGKQALTLDVYAFLERVYKYEFVTPLGFGCKLSSHWADTKEEVKYDVFRDGTSINRS